MAFRRLFLKEFKSAMPIYVFFSAAVLVLHLFALYKSDDWEDGAIQGISVILPYSLACVLAVGTVYYQLRSEWKANTVYLLLSLPVRGWKVMTAKLAAAIGWLILACMWIAVSFSLLLLLTNWSRWQASETLPEAWPSLLNLAGNVIWIYLIFASFGLITVQFAFLCGQLVSKFRWLVEGCAFIAILWLVLRVSPMLSGLLQWMPSIVFGGDELQTVYLNSGSFVGLLLISVALTWLNGYIFEREVEV